MALLDNVDTFLLDCDGVLWNGDLILDGAAETVAFLRSKGKRVVFVTNNSSKSRESYVQKFRSLGIAAEKEDVFGSAYAAAYYIKNFLHIPKGKKVYLCGMAGLEEELAAENIEYVGASHDSYPIESMTKIGEIQPDNDVEVVLFGFDLEFNYRKLAKAFTYLTRNEKCHFLATNTDLTYPAANALYPGTGALLSALTAPLGKMPIVMGKPEQAMLDVIVQRFDLDRSRICMVGDRLDTDILFGQKGGTKTLLVLTGVTKVDDLASSNIKPDIVLPTFGHLRSHLQNEI
ncbi:hypothetical protein HDU97_009738 [Phlyctochytrium planicorne]|nr:hypothetical protein HDU97_009738 [Phlyctochytrium planicorne]